MMSESHKKALIPSDQPQRVEVLYERLERIAQARPEAERWLAEHWQMRELQDKLKYANARIARLEDELLASRNQIISWHADIVMLNRSLKDARAKLIKAEKRTLKYKIVAMMGWARQLLGYDPRGRARGRDDR